MQAQIIVIHLMRLGKAERSYREGFIADDGTCLRTFSKIPKDVSARMSEKFRSQNWIHASQIISSVYKYHFYNEYFNIVEYRDQEDKLAGYYCDIATPLEKIGGEYFLTDLILDLWINPYMKATELDRDEFESALANELIPADLASQASAALERLKNEVAQGRFPTEYLKHNP